MTFSESQSICIIDYRRFWSAKLIPLLWPVFGVYHPSSDSFWNRHTGSITPWDKRERLWLILKVMTSAKKSCIKVESLAWRQLLVYCGPGVKRNSWWRLCDRDRLRRVEVLRDEGFLPSLRPWSIEFQAWLGPNPPWSLLQMSSPVTDAWRLSRLSWT